MIEKITAFVFGLAALALEVWQSLVNPSVESIVAACFAAVIVIATGISIFRKEYITLSESLPKDNRANSKVLKLANEIAPYIKEKDGRITLKIRN